MSISLPTVGVLPMDEPTVGSKVTISSGTGGDVITWVGNGVSYGAGVGAGVTAMMGGSVGLNGAGVTAMMGGSVGLNVGSNVGLQISMDLQFSLQSATPSITSLSQHSTTVSYVTNILDMPELGLSNPFEHFVSPSMSVMI
jgi:hypothetical protein